MVVCKVFKGKESLEDEEHSGQPLEVDDDQLRAIIKDDRLITTWEIAKELNLNNFTVVQHSKQTGKVKKLTANQKNRKSSFWNVVFFYSTQQQQIISWLDVMCDDKWIFLQQSVMTSSVVGPRKSSNLQKPNLHQKKVMITVWRSAAGLIHYSFLNPSKTITSEKHAQQIDEMHPKLQRLHLALFNRKDPILLHNNTQLHVP